MTLVATVALPDNPLGRYLNVETVVMEAPVVPRFVKARIGRVQVPTALADVALRQAIGRLHPDVQDVSDLVDEIRFFPGRMRVVYRWHGDAIESLRARLVPQVDRERLRAYNDQLVRTARGVGARPGLDELLGPLLVHAAERSRSGDPVAENRAAITVLENYVNGHGLGSLVPEAREWPSARSVEPRIQGRTDFPQHFMTSALLAATAGSVVSDAVGIYKEIEDARGGSGFSFTDIVADRAGTRFGELSVRSEASARRVQEAAVGGLRNDELMPPALDLPEHMTEAEFRRRFGSTDDPRYRKVTEEIEQRIDALELFR